MYLVYNLEKTHNGSVMIVSKIYSKKEYDEYFNKNSEVFKERYIETLKLQKQNADQDKSFSYRGYSITALKEVDFLVDWMYSDGININWRERLVCPETGLCNRLRASYHLMLNELHFDENDRIYITEQVTPFYDFLNKKFSHLVGSEFISSECEPGSTNESKIRHEDLTNLSFKTNSLDRILSFDVLEHVPNYKSALRECLRVLKANGTVLMSFPFDSSREKNLIRAAINEEDEIEHFVDPEYHGDPINDAGCLSFYTFGWELLDEMRQLGFSDVHAVFYWSKEHGYLGPDQISIIAKKPKFRAFVDKLKSLI